MVSPLFLRPGASGRQRCRVVGTVPWVCNAGPNKGSARIANSNDDEGARNTEEMVRRDLEALKAAKGSNSSTANTEKSGVEKMKDLVSTILLVDFFLVVFLLAWLVVALVPHFVSKNDTLLDPWLILWQPFIQPVLGVLMLGTIVQGTISYVSGNK